MITLNRPERLNAWTPTMAEEQVDAITRANDDPAVGAIVTTGAGRGFCAGADMQDDVPVAHRRRRPRPRHGGRSRRHAGRARLGDFVRSAKPMVAAINGPAVGIGVTMCLPMDQIVTSPAAKFGMGFIKMGLVPELASSRLLADRVGFGRASDLCLSGRLVSGEEAHRIGLADRLADADELLDTADRRGRGVRRESGATAAHGQAAADAEHRRRRSRRRAAGRAPLPPRSAGPRPSTPKPSRRSPRSVRRSSPAEAGQQLVSSGGTSRSMR